MIDLAKIIRGMSEAVNAANFPDPIEIGAAIGLEIAHASVKNTRSGDLLISGAMLDRESTAVNVVGLSKPRRLYLMLANSQLPYAAIRGQAFGSKQSVQLSKIGKGLAVVFESESLSWAVTAPSPDGLVDTVYC